MDINNLVKLTSRSWALPILALMHAGVAGRQAPLLAATTASRTAFSQSLSHLIDLDLLERNPGHGHPLRPEYRLTGEGARVAKIAGGITGAMSDQTEAVLLRRAWTVPVLAVIDRPRYFTDIKSDLLPITDRALSQSLRHLEDRKWLLREIDPSKRHPRPTYRAMNAGARIGAVVQLTG